MAQPKAHLVFENLRLRVYVSQAQIEHSSACRQLVVDTQVLRTRILFAGIGKGVEDRVAALAFAMPVSCVPGIVISCRRRSPEMPLIQLVPFIFPPGARSASVTMVRLSSACAVCGSSNSPATRRHKNSQRCRRSGCETWYFFPPQAVDKVHAVGSANAAGVCATSTACCRLSFLTALFSV